MGQESRGLVPVRRVAVTGMAVACGLGLELEGFWSGILEGRCGIRHLELLDEHELPVKVGGLVEDELLAQGCERYGIRHPDRADQLGLYVIGRALEEAGLPTDGEAPLALDVVVGTGHGTVLAITAGHKAFLKGGYRRIRPTAVLRSMFNRVASLGSIEFKLTGDSHVVSAACASGSVAFGDAFQRIRFGLSEGAVAACCDAGFDGGTFGAWNRLGVLSRIEEPERASRPFDKERDGLVMAEGAAAFVLEPWDAAEARGAPILAEVVGYGCRSDAHHIAQPDADGQVRAMHVALESAGLEPADIDYVNAHGTATELADVVEAASVGRVLGARAESVPVSNTKAQLGHLMGATAGVELAATILAMRAGVIPPCRNLDDPDPRCPLSFVRDRPLETSIRHAMKNSFAFGGTNSVVILKRA